MTVRRSPCLLIVGLLVLLIVSAVPFGEYASIASGAPRPTRTPTATRTSTATSTPTLIPNSNTHPAGCKVGEVYVDSQAWWINPDGGSGDDFGHLHTSVCWPYLATFDAPYPINVRSAMHNNPGTLREIRVQSWDGGPVTPVCNDSAAIVCLTFPATAEMPVRTIANCVVTGGELKDGGHTCVWWDTVTIDPATIAKSGWQQFRFRGFVVEPDGNEMRTSTGLHARVVNSQPVGDFCDITCDMLETRGWYTGAGYANANITAPLTSIVSGVWYAKVQMRAGASGLPITEHYAAIDTDFHNGDPGIPVRKGNGEFRGSLIINTKELTNGWHRLMLKADAFDQTSGSTNSGVMVTWFEVQN